MKVFLALLLGAFVSSAFWAIAYGGTPSIGLEVAAKVLFVAAVVANLQMGRAALYLRPLTLAVAVGLYILCVVLSAVAAILVYPASPFAARALAAPVMATGHYPQGFDVPLAYGGTMWVATSVIVIGSAIGLGAGLRRWRGSSEARR